jgi:outer membrane protein assembly factor BamD (BamD/ComL family)
VLLASRRAEEALAALEGLPGETAAAIRGRALLVLGRWGEAEAVLAGAGSRGALADRAEALHRLGRTEEAIRLLAGTDLHVVGRLRLAAFRLSAGDWEGAARELRTAEPESRRERQQAKLIGAQILLAKGDYAAAQSHFEALGWEGAELSEPLRASVMFGLATAREKIGGPESADQGIEEFLSNNPGSPDLAEAFARLDELYAKQEDPPEDALEKWAADEPAGRAAYARYYLALADLRQGRADRGLKRLDEFARLNPEHPLLARSHLEAGRILAGTGEREGALARFDTAMRAAGQDQDLLAEIEIAAGNVQFWAREYLLAANLFGNAAGRSAKWREEALFYSALSWLHLGNFDRFRQETDALVAAGGEGWRVQALALEEGFALARRGDAAAGSQLREFLSRFPDHPHAGEARLALAELAFLDAPPRISDTFAYLKAVNEGGASPETAARAEVLAIFAADAPGSRDEEKVLALGEAFLDAHADSPLRAEVRMKLGQVHFRREDYAGAQRQFQLLATEQPESPLAETALYLAGESALRGLNAQSLGASLALFGAVAKREGSPLAAHARLQQAIAQGRLGNLKEANLLFDAVLRVEPEPEVRFAAMAGKADNLAALAEADPAQWAAAAEILDRLAADPAAPPFWKNQALYKKSRCLRRSGREGEALVVLYDLVARRDEGGAEFYWFYRAGFDAAQMLEEKGDWPSAIGMYRKMAEVPGPRSAEAAERARRLRLEHFVWEQ